MRAVPVAAGDGSVGGFRGLNSAQRLELDRAIRAGEQLSRCEFSVFVGPTEGDPRAYAVRLHSALSAPHRSILVMVDPTRRVFEIVTGADVRRQLSDAQTDLARVTMQSAFAAGGGSGAETITDGIIRGIASLAEHARPARTRHA